MEVYYLFLYSSILVFRRGHDGGLLWPGFGDNIRVIDWILGRAAGIQNKINKNLILKSNSRRHNPFLEGVGSYCLGVLQYIEMYCNILKCIAIY